MTTGSPIVIGIDTGGSYTDGVLFDRQTKRVIFSRKVLTTHQDLRICITAILDSLIGEAENAGRDIQLISLSTTLATNAIAEGKSRPAALLLLGYDEELLRKFGLTEELGTQRFFCLKGGSDLNGNLQADLDESEIKRIAREQMGEVEAFAVSAYGGPLNSSHELLAAEWLGQAANLPVVQGNQLTNRMGSIQRAATAALNASLLGHAVEFVEAVREVMRRHALDCPLILVRGDGSLAEADYAMQRPVEIIHSGPATSTVGGAALAGADNALVIDVGGTTTDLGLVRDGGVLLNADGAEVGGIATWVRTIRARSFGLGGDSQIRFSGKEELALGPDRVLPLSRMATEYPEAGAELREYLAAAGEVHRNSQLEFWLLRREPRHPPADPRVREMLEILRSGPRRMRSLLKQLKIVSPLLLDIPSLIQAGVLEKAGLTPTDLMHCLGTFEIWDRETAESALRAIRMVCPSFMADCRGWIKRKIAVEVISFLSGSQIKTDHAQVNRKDFGRWVFDEIFHPDNTLVPQVRLSMPLVGIGAPVRFFMEGLDSLFHTDLVFPDHYEVANAVGTVAAKVSVRYEGEVIPIANGPVIIGYAGVVLGTRKVFEDRDSAVLWVKEKLDQAARREALLAGTDSPQLSWEEEDMGAEICRYRVHAQGEARQG